MHIIIVDDLVRKLIEYLILQKRCGGNELLVGLQIFMKTLSKPYCYHILTIEQTVRSYLIFSRYALNFF